MKKLLSVILCAAILLSSVVFAYAEDDKTLSFKEDGTFTILHITDPQDDQNLSYDMLNLLKVAIEKAKPDLVVFTGDMVEDRRAADPGVDDDGTFEGVCVYDENGDVIYDKTLENIKTATEGILSVFNDAKIPFVIAQGNNDHSVGISNETWLELYSKYEYCLVKDESDDSEGRIDYNVEIKGYNSDETKFNIWMMDSGKEKVTKEQIEWYKKESSALTAANGGTPVPAFEFQHIQVDDIGNLFKLCPVWKEGAAFSGICVARLNRDIAQGHVDTVYRPCIPTKQFRAWKKQGDVIGAFFGHSHYDGFSGVYKGIEMGFTFGCEFSKSGPYGFRVLTLHEDDIKNYDNVLYTYNGSVLTGDVKIDVQQDEPYTVYNTFKERFIAFWQNIIATFNTI